MWLLFITDLNDHALIKNMDLLFNTEMDIEVQYPEDSLFILKNADCLKKLVKLQGCKKIVISVPHLSPFK